MGSYFLGTVCKFNILNFIVCEGTKELHALFSTSPCTDVRKMASMCVGLVALLKRWPYFKGFLFLEQPSSILTTVFTHIYCIVLFTSVVQLPLEMLG